MTALERTLGKQLHSMLVFDALVYNEDRHFGNFGLLRDNHSGKIIAPAPLFDHGQSLLPFAGKDDLEDLEHLKDYARLRANPYNVSRDMRRGDGADPADSALRGIPA